MARVIFLSLSLLHVYETASGRRVSYNVRLFYFYHTRYTHTQKYLRVMKKHVLTSIIMCFCLTPTYKILNTPSINDVCSEQGELKTKKN